MKKFILALLLLLPSIAHADEIAMLGATSRLVNFFVSDSSSTTGAGLALPLVYNTGSLTCYYKRSDQSAAVAITLSAGTIGTWSSSGATAGTWIVIDNTNMPGWYQLSLPDAALSAGTNTILQCKGAANMAPMNLRIILTAATPDVNCASASTNAFESGDFQTGYYTSITTAAGNPWILANNAANTAAGTMGGGICMSIKKSP